MNIRKSLDTISCEGVLCIVVQFATVEYNFLQYQFLLSQTSPPQFDSHFASEKLLNVYVLHFLDKQ